MIKPDREIFDHHNREFDLRRETTLFIDDSEKNVSSARDFGWQAIQFAGRDGAEKLTEGLLQHGIEV